MCITDYPSVVRPSRAYRSGSGPSRGASLPPRTAGHLLLGQDWLAGSTIMPAPINRPAGNQPEQNPSSAASRRQERRASCCPGLFRDPSSPAQSMASTPQLAPWRAHPRTRRLCGEHNSCAECPSFADSLQSQFADRLPGSSVPDR